MEVPKLDTCTSLRRHSFSAPSLLDDCLAKCAKLSNQVTRVTDQARRHRAQSKSVSDLSSIGNTELKMPRGQCHQCHRPLHHPEHVGVAPGVSKCTLEHFDLCPGGRKAQKDWAACPSDNELDDDLSEGQEDEVHQVPFAPAASMSSDEDKMDFHSQRVDLDPTAVAKALAMEASRAENVVLDDSDEEDTDDEEEILLQEDITRLNGMAWFGMFWYTCKA